MNVQENKLRKNAKENNGMWKGNDVGIRNARNRPRRWYKKMPCEVCGNERSEIHHKDENVYNNEKENIQFLCRKHHMEIDGRMKILTTKHKGNKDGGWIYCGTCHKPHRNKVIKKHILETGKCFACEHAYGETIHE